MAALGTLMLVGSLIVLVVVVAIAVLLRCILVHLRRAGSKLLGARVAVSSHIVHFAMRVSTGAAVLTIFETTYSVPVAVGRLAAGTASQGSCRRWAGPVESPGEPSWAPRQDVQDLDIHWRRAWAAGRQLQAA